MKRFLIKKVNIPYTLTILLLFFTGSAFAQSSDSVIVFTGQVDKNYITEDIYYLEDKSHDMTVSELQNQPFKLSGQEVLNLGVSSSVFWFKIPVKNVSGINRIILEVDNPLLNRITLYTPGQNGGFKEQEIGKFQSFWERNNYNTNTEFELYQQKGTTVTYYLRVESFTQLIIPIKLGTYNSIRLTDLNRNLLNGLYFGIMLVMFFYNLFVYLSTRDKSYLYYILYILSVSLVQLNVTGFGFKYLWPNAPGFERASIFLFPALTAFASIAFIKQFLLTKQFAPRAEKLFWVFIAAYGFNIVNSFFGDKYLAYNLLNAIALPLSLYMLGMAGYIWMKHKYKPAVYFLAAWTIFLLGIICFVLKDAGILPYNLITVSSIQIGSAIEVILLSFALADRINILKKEKESSREEALRVSQENERIIREQNIILETKVNERTMALKASNEELAKTLHELKETETQLVESEKMASLGQLTAGIAHEINNPINFVTSNVNPLRRDVDLLVDLLEQVEEITLKDAPVEQKKQEIAQLKEELDFDYLKSEIGFLLKGINEGASRTAEIVKGLRVFSRLDEDDLKKADINEGLDSTIVIVNHLLNGSIEIEKNYSGIPLVECFPGKLNQVFLNLMSNSIHAIDKKWKGEPGGKLTLGTWNDETDVYIRVKDNGIGMDESTKKKLFEPFFTTKDVGEGTGLGLSIAYNTVRKHNGMIEVNGEPGEGAEFIIKIPIIHSN